MDIVIRPFAGTADAAAFRSLNEEWITQHFVLEEHDRHQLEHPQECYIEPGGEILMAELDGRAVGCVALVPDGERTYELSKMAVEPGLRGHGTGRRLVQAAIDCARGRGATSLFLASSHKLPAALHLYEQAGFAHVAPVDTPYARADVYMSLALE